MNVRFLRLWDELRTNLWFVPTMMAVTLLQMVKIMDQASLHCDTCCILVKLMYNQVCILFINHAPRTIPSLELVE